jgi:ActR/RegA family two-component response regulator/GGDEF domain-containing protein
MREQATADKDAKRILQPGELAERLASELSRVRLRGGFVSLLLVGGGHAASARGDEWASAAAVALEKQTRRQDVVGRLESEVAVIMPGTDSDEVLQAGRRLLRLVASSRPARKLSAGVATAFGDVEGGASALIAAAGEALHDAAPGRVAASRSLRGRPAVLVVDDDLPFAQAICDEICERGWEAHPCTTIEDAMQRTEGPCYSALFVDLVLARGTGIDVIRRAVASAPWRPVVLMTGYEIDPATVLEVLELGPVLFVKKPLAGTGLDVALQMFRDSLFGRPAHARRLSPAA